jgi:hypothetical protein
MVDVEFIVNNDKQILTARCPEKSTTAIHVKKTPGGYKFFEIHVEKGVVPKELSGKYTSILRAKDAIQRYFNTLSPTKAVKREAFGKDFEERKKRNATESNSKGS